MTREEILAEIGKESPDWLAISNAAKAIYESSSESGSLGFLRGHINIVKSPEGFMQEIKEELKSCMPDAEFLVVGWYGITVTDFNKMMPSLKDRFVIAVTDRPQVLANVAKAGMSFRHFKCSIKNRYEKTKPTMICLKGEGVDIMAEIGTLKAVARDMMIEKIFA